MKTKQASASGRVVTRDVPVRVRREEHGRRTMQWFTPPAGDARTGASAGRGVSLRTVLR